jgi:hypothetical protein
MLLLANDQFYGAIPFNVAELANRNVAAFTRRRRPQVLAPPSGLSAHGYRRVGRDATLLTSAQLVGTVKHALRISLTAGILLAVASCTAPAGTAPASTPPAPTTTTSVAAPATETPSSPALQTFTFPDGHISFAYPAGWSVRTPQEGPYLNVAHRDASVESVEVIVADGSGAELARVMSGMYGDNAAGPVKRTVLDHAPVPGIPDTAGEPAEFGFALDEFVGVDSYYFMDVRLAHEFLPAQEDSGTNQVSVPNGEMAAYVVFDSERQPVFATPDLAKVWMATDQYAQLKALLLSLKYS